jgi:hypothetical protein
MPFTVVNSGLDVSSKAVTEKIDRSFAAFDEQIENDPQRTEKYLQKANDAKKLSDDLFNQIEDLKRQVIIGSGGMIDKETHKKIEIKNDMSVTSLMQKGELFDDRNLEVSTNVMINKGNGDKLKASINKARADFLALVDDPNAKKELESQIPLKAEDPTEKVDGVLKDWTAMNFEMVPTIAAVTLLNKYQNDIRNSEGLLVDYLLKQVNAKTVVVDRIQAKVIAPTSYVWPDKVIRADILLPLIVLP